MRQLLESLARAARLFHCGFKRSCFQIEKSTNRGMASYAATETSPRLRLSARYGVTREGTSNRKIAYGQACSEVVPRQVFEYNQPMVVVVTL